MAQQVQTITGVIQPSASFSRPTDTTAYAIGDLVANSTSNAAVVPLSWRVGVATSDRHSVYVAGARLRLDNPVVTAASFRVHLFKATPTFVTGGDNSAFGTVVATGYANWLGSLDATIVAVTADGVAGMAEPTDGVIIPYHLTGLDPGSPVVLFGLVEALAAYTPKNAGVFTVELLVEMS